MELSPLIPWKSLPLTSLLRAGPRLDYQKLDSIANLAVSAPQHEVYAVALEGAPPSIQLVLAGNDAVPKRTIEHIQALWRYLQRLAEDYAKHHNLTETAESPPQAKRDRLPASARRRTTQFEREATKFCGEKLNRRSSEYLSSFKQIDCSGLLPESRFLNVYRGVMSLTKGLESRAAFSDDKWEKLADASKNFDRQVEILLQEDLTYLHKRMRKDFPIDRYLMKVTALSKDTKILLNRANSPGLLP